MSYQRKTKDVYFIIWNNEEVDEFDTRIEAREMVKEYNMAFKGGCFIRRKRIKMGE